MWAIGVDVGVGCWHGLWAWVAGVGCWCGLLVWGVGVGGWCGVRLGLLVWAVVGGVVVGGGWRVLV